MYIGWGGGILGHMKLLKGRGEKQPTITEYSYMSGTVSGTFIDSILLSPYNDPVSQMLHSISILKWGN